MGFHITKRFLDILESLFIFIKNNRVALHNCFRVQHNYENQVKTEAECLSRLTLVEYCIDLHLKYIIHEL